MDQFKKYKWIAIGCLFLTACCLMISLQNDLAFCLSVDNSNQVIHHAEMNGFTSDEPILFLISGIICFLFSIIFCFIRAKKTFLILNLVLWFLFAIPMGLFFTAPFYQVIYDSIHSCGNQWLFGAVIALYSYLFFGLIYVVKAKA